MEAQTWETKSHEHQRTPAINNNSNNVNDDCDVSVKYIWLLKSHTGAHTHNPIRNAIYSVWKSLEFCTKNLF